MCPPKPHGEALAPRGRAAGGEAFGVIGPGGRGPCDTTHHGVHACPRGRPERACCCSCHRAWWGTTRGPSASQAAGLRAPPVWNCSLRNREKPGLLCEQPVCGALGQCPPAGTHLIREAISGILRGQGAGPRPAHGPFSSGLLTETLLVWAPRTFQTGLILRPGPAPVGQERSLCPTRPGKNREDTRQTVWSGAGKCCRPRATLHSVTLISPLAFRQTLSPHAGGEASRHPALGPAPPPPNPCPCTRTCSASPQCGPHLLRPSRGLPGRRSTPGLPLRTCVPILPSVPPRPPMDRHTPALPLEQRCRPGRHRDV